MGPKTWVQGLPIRGLGVFPLTFKLGFLLGPGWGLGDKGDSGWDAEFRVQGYTVTGIRVEVYA